MKAIYEEIRHGEKGFRIGVYSETLYGADYKYHEDFEFLYVAEGTLKIGVEDKAYEAPPGTVFFFDRSRPHYVDKSEAEKQDGCSTGMQYFSISPSLEKKMICAGYFLKTIPLIQCLNRIQPCSGT